MRKHIALAFGLLLIGGIPLAKAEVKAGGMVETSPPKSLPSVNNEAAPAPVRDQRRTGGQVLRCWQNGRLLYEGSGFRTGLDRNPNGIGVLRTDNESVVVLDLKQGMCILSPQ